MCTHYLAKAIAKTAIEEITGVKFEEKVLGVASPEALEQLNNVRKQQDALKKHLQEEVEAFKKQQAEKYRGLWDGLAAEKKEAWVAILEPLGLDANDPDTGAIINRKTGEVTRTQANIPDDDNDTQEEQPACSNTN